MNKPTPTPIKSLESDPYEPDYFDLDDGCWIPDSPDFCTDDEREVFFGE